MEYKIIEDNKCHVDFRDRPFVFLFKSYLLNFGFLKNIMDIFDLTKDDKRSLIGSFFIYQTPKYLIDTTKLQKEKFNIIKVPDDAIFDDVITSFSYCLNNDENRHRRELVMMNEYCSSTRVLCEAIKYYRDDHDYFKLYSDTIFYMFNITPKILKTIHKIPTYFVFFERSNEIEYYFREYDYTLIPIARDVSFTQKN
jgi:hypothetical protein